MVEGGQQGGSAVPVEQEDYRVGVYNLFLTVKLLALVILSLTVFLGYLVWQHQPQDTYYAETAQTKAPTGEISAGKKIRLAGLPEPYINRQKLLLWATQAAPQIMTFGFSDINQKFSESRKLFTPKGWNAFEGALKNSQLRKELVEFRQVITATPSADATIFSEGVYGGKYTWIVDIPMLLTARAGEKKQTTLVQVRMWIVRMPTFEKPDGIGIDFWVSR